MKRRLAFLDGLVRGTLAIVLACLFVFHAAGLTRSAASPGPTLSQGAVAATIRATAGVARAAGEHCDRLSRDGAPADGRCDHMGFCALCSAGGRDGALFDAPPPSPLIAILMPADARPGRLARGVERDFPSPSSSGLDKSRLATAPPRA